MSDVIAVVLACLYVAGIIIAAGDAMIDEHTERAWAARAQLDAVRDGALDRVRAAQHRLRWSGLWPVLLIAALWRLRRETAPRHQNPTPRHR